MATPDAATKICIECGGKCCRYFALEIDTADSQEEYEKVRWYLAHKKTWVFIDDDKWHVMVLNECEFLGADNLCTNYENRPAICREYQQDNCEKDSDLFYDILFKNLAEFDLWIAEQDA